MTLGNLLSRAYHVLMDDKDSPRSYPRADLVGYVNRGTLLFRQRVEDKWFRATVPLVAGQGVYSFPLQNVRAQRLSFDDTTVPPMSLIGMQAGDSGWQTTVGPIPVAWTSDGLPSNQFRIYPVPTSSSGETFDFAIAGAGGGSSADDGIVVQYSDPGNATFTTDPFDPGHTDPEAGIIVAVSGAQMLDDIGEIMDFDAPGIDALEVWCVERPDDITNADDSEIDIKAGYELAPLWYALWQAYLEEGEHHDSNLAGMYQSMWNDLVDRASERKENPLPNQVHVVGTGSSPRAKMFPDFSSTMTVNGSPVNVRWPRSGAFPRLGD